jgi:glycosyltransferase involved in cell wall biosynthesis
MRIYHAVAEKIKSVPFKSIAHDIVAVRLPPSDQLLNAAGAGSLFAMQLSRREGFEIKVTELLHQGKPMIVSDSGGIPHQVRNGHTGFITPFGDIEMVAERMERLTTDEALREEMSKAAANCSNEEFWLVSVAENCGWVCL